MKTTLCLFGCCVLACASGYSQVQESSPPDAVLCAPDASPLEHYAAREVRRYFFACTGRLLPLVTQAEDSGTNCIVVMRQDRLAWAQTFTADTIDMSGMESGAYLLRTVAGKSGNRRRLVLAGAGDTETLYAAYRFAELLGVRFYLHGDVVPDRQQPDFVLPVVEEYHAPLFDLRGIQPFHDFPEGPDWWSLEHYRALLTQLPKMGMNFIGLHTYPLAEPTVWVGIKEDVNDDGTVKRAYPSQYYNTGMQVGWGYAVRPTGAYSCGASQIFERDDYGMDFLNAYTPRPDSEEEHRAVFNVTGEVFNQAFGLARKLGVKTCIGTETPLKIPEYLLHEKNRSTGSIQPLGGSVAHYGSPIAGTDDDPLYQSVRYNLNGYRFMVPEGTYTVTLKFSEVAYETVGARVFDVLVQDKPVLESLDIFATAGKNAALEYTYENVAVTDGTLNIGFRYVIELPAIAAIAVEGADTVLKVNCGGDTYGDWQADAGLEADPALVQEVYEGIFTHIMRTHPLDYYWFWTPEGWTWDGANEAQAVRTLNDLSAAYAARDAVNAPFRLATCGWVLGPPFDRAYLDHHLPDDVAVSTINRHLGYAPVDAAFGEIHGRGKWAIPWVEDDPGMSIPQFWARRMRRDARTAREYGCDGLMGIFWRTHVIAPTLSALARAGWNQDWPEPEEPESHYRVRDVEAGFPIYTACTTAPVEGTDDDALYGTVRLDASDYILKVPDGAYNVVLHFCELQHGPGTRVFDVKIQDKQVIRNLDIAQEVGGNTALQKTFDDIAVNDGWLRITFARKKDWPCIAAIEATGEHAAVKINCGAGSHGAFMADVPQRPADPSALDFYTDWAAHEFGEGAGAEAGRIFHQLDGTHPRTASWIGGPGMFFPDNRPWELVYEAYDFVDAFTALRDTVSGAGNLERFDYWLHTLAFLRATGRMNCLWGAFNQAMAAVKAAPAEQQKTLAQEKALPARLALAEAVRDAYTHLLSTVTSPGELGTVCNFEARAIIATLEEPAKELEALLGAPLPEEAGLPRDYNGPARLIVPSVRTSRGPKEPVDIKVMTLSATPPESMTLCWRVMGQGQWQKEPFDLVARHVYRKSFTLFPAGEDIEYYIEAFFPGNAAVCWPPTAPDLSQTVVVLPEAGK